jgi:hypothetical protein
MNKPAVEDINPRQTKTPHTRTAVGVSACGERKKTGADDE